MGNEKKNLCEKRNYHNLGLISYRLLSHEMNCLSELCHDL